jgi:hypothetical protein
MQSLAVAIQNVTDRADRYLTVSAVASGQTPPQATAALEKAIKATSKPILIFIDEVDYITPGSPTSTLWKLEFNKFLEKLQSCLSRDISQRERGFGYGERCVRKMVFGSRHRRN